MKITNTLKRFHAYLFNIPQIDYTKPYRLYVYKQHPEEYQFITNHTKDLIMYYEGSKIKKFTSYDKKLTIDCILIPEKQLKYIKSLDTEDIFLHSL